MALFIIGFCQRLNSTPRNKRLRQLIPKTQNQSRTASIHLPLPEMPPPPRRAHAHYAAPDTNCRQWYSTAQDLPASGSTYGQGSHHPGNGTTKQTCDQIKNTSNGSGQPTLIFIRMRFRALANSRGDCRNTDGINAERGKTSASNPVNTINGETGAEYPAAFIAAIPGAFCDAIVTRKRGVQRSDCEQTKNQGEYKWGERV